MDVVHPRHLPTRLPITGSVVAILVAEHLIDHTSWWWLLVFAALVGRWVLVFITLLDEQDRTPKWQ